MKQAFILFVGLLTAFSVQAHKNIGGNNLTVSINGNKNLQVSVDGRDFNLSNSSSLGNKTTFVLNNLEMGQHTLLIIRTDLNSMRSGRVSAPFNLRSNYEMLINVNNNGSLELIENMKSGINDNQVSMSSSDFNILLRDVRAQRSASKRRNTISNAFDNTSKYFTTNQVVQLLQLVNAENFRLQLAKLSYHSVTDRSNFYQVYDLLNSQAGKDELVAYVNNLNDDNSSNSAMNNASFNALYENIHQQWPVSTQMNSLTSAFNNTANYFSVYQASQLIQLVSAESNRLQLAKLSYRTITDPGNFNQIYNLLSTQASKNELAAYINNNGNNTNVAMTDANFNSLFRTIQQQWPVSAQMSSLNNVFSNTANYFTVYQASQLIQIVSAESNRLQLAKLSYRSITDPDNFNQIYNLLSTQASKNELATYVNNNNNGSNHNSAMTDVNFNSLYRTIQQQWPVGTQMNSLTSAFNNTTNYFSVYQASQLIQLVSAESNRLQLAKLSYRSITDPGNFNQIYNLLNSQASKTELAAYINNNFNTDSNPNGAMTDANFNSLYQTIQQQWPVSAQMNSLRNAFNNPANYFITYQASQLIQIVNAEENRLQLAKLSYRTITDPANFNQIYNLLNTQASKNELAAYLNTNYNTGTVINAAMTDANFTALYQSIERQYLPFEQMNSLTSAFNNTSNYFTSAQAKQLIPLVSLESNRLQLAKLSYRTITDRNNFVQVYDLLNTQASRNELDAYVKAYRD